MDESLDFLCEAADYLDKYIPISDVDVILEATPFAKKANENNKNMGNGAMASIKKAIDAIILVIKKAITAVTNFLQEAFMSKEDRTKFAYFKKLASQDKAFANKPIRVSDYRAYKKAYGGALNELDRLYKSGASPDQVNPVMYKLNKTLNDIKNRSGKAGAAAVATVGMAAAVKLANDNVICAQGIKKALDAENGQLQGLLSQVAGDKQAAAFKSKVDNYSRNAFFHRAKVNLLNRQQNDIAACGKSLMSRLTAFVKQDDNGNYHLTKGSVVKGLAKNKDVVGAAMRGASGDVNKKGSVKGAVKGAFKAADTVGQAKSYGKAAKRLVGKG